MSCLRSDIRDWIREMAAVDTLVVNLTISSCNDSIRLFFATEPDVDASAGNWSKWRGLESWVHLCSALSAQCAQEASDHVRTALAGPAESLDSQRSSCGSDVLQLLSSVTTIPQFRSCRPLARMAVVFISDIIPNLVLETFAKARGQEEDIPIIAAVRQLLRDAMWTMIHSLQHSEEAPMDCPLMPFRVKQDHIGVVGLLKLAPAFGFAVCRAPSVLNVLGASWQALNAVGILDQPVRCVDGLRITLSSG